MEIISYLKGKKAQKEIESLKQVIGQDQHKSGAQDVTGSFATAHERISSLEEKNKDREMSGQIERLTKMVATNLNKHALQSRTYLLSHQLNMDNVMVDALADGTGLNLAESDNVVYDSQTKSIHQKDPNKPALLKLQPLVSEQPIHLLLFEMALSENQSVARTFLLPPLTLTKNPDGYYKPSYEIINNTSIFFAEPVLLENFKITDLTKPAGTNVEIFIKVGANFKPVQEVYGLYLEGQVEVKFVITTGQTELASKTEIDSTIGGIQVNNFGQIGIMPLDKEPVIREPVIEQQVGSVILEENLSPTRLTHTINKTIGIKIQQKEPDLSVPPLPESIQMERRLILEEPNAQVLYTADKLLQLKSQYEIGRGSQ